MSVSELHSQNRSLETAQRRLDKTRRDINDEHKKQIKTLENVREIHKKQVGHETARKQAKFVEISKKNQKELDLIQKNSTTQKRTQLKLAENQIQNLSKQLAKQFKAMQSNAAEKIAEFHQANLKDFQNIAQKTMDPFYSGEKLDTVLTSDENSIELKVKLPEHEAKNVLVHKQGPRLKISFARRHSVETMLEGGGKNMTNKYQSITETFDIPKDVDTKKMKRTYKDGILSIKMPYMKFAPNSNEAKRDNLEVSQGLRQS